jgi:hypothetical protein
MRLIFEGIMGFIVEKIADVSRRKTPCKSGEINLNNL